MGMVNLMRTLGGSPPQLYRLKKLKIATKHEANYTLVSVYAGCVCLVGLMRTGKITLRTSVSAWCMSVCLLRSVVRYGENLKILHGVST